MAKVQTPAIPDTHTLRSLMEEYLEMLHDVERGVKRLLALDPQTEKFWDEAAELAPPLTIVGARSNSIQEEIVDLIDKLPED